MRAEGGAKKMGVFFWGHFGLFKNLAAKVLNMLVCTRFMVPASCQYVFSSAGGLAGTVPPYFSQTYLNLKNCVFALKNTTMSTRYLASLFNIACRRRRKI